jgi:hypothetical protein
VLYSYVPPTFDLFEFDDESLHLGQQGRRQFNDWNGLANQPAQEVTLAWRTDRAVVLVATSDHADADGAWARLTAVHMALGGDTLPIPARPDSDEATHGEIQRLTSTEEFWRLGPALFDSGSLAHVAVCDGFSVGYGHMGDIMVCIAATGIRPDQFKVRKVRDGTVYDIDPGNPHPLSELG